MPGVDLALDLPSLADSLTEIVTKLTVALSAIQDDLAGDVTPSEMDINTSLSFAGNYATNVGALGLVGGNAPSTAGSVYYSDGEFYAIDSTGVVQLTSNGSVNVTGTGGITGDYGAGSETVSYDNGLQEYSFTSSPGVYADIICDDVVLHSATGSVRLGCDDAITTARLATIKSLPAAGVSFLVYNAATSTIEDGGVTAVTNAPTFSALTLTTLTVTNPIIHGDEGIVLSMNAGATTTGTVSLTNRAFTRSGVGTATWEQSICLKKGDRIKKAGVYVHVVGAPTVTVQIIRNVFSLGDAVLATNSTTTTGRIEATLTGVDPFADNYDVFGLDSTVGDAWILKVTITGGTSGDEIHSPLVTFIHEA